MKDKRADLQKTSELIKANWRETTVPGLLCVEVSHLHIHAVLATVYYKVDERAAVIEIVSTYVIDWARRNGLRSKINDALFDWYPDVKSINSPRGTKEGTAFMRAYGYRKLKSGWRVHRKWRKRKAAI